MRPSALLRLLLLAEPDCEGSELRKEPVGLMNNDPKIDWWIACPLIGVFLVPLILHVLGVAFP